MTASIQASGIGLSNKLEAALTADNVNDPSNLTATAELRLGHDYVAAFGNPLDGSISEFILYDKDLGANTRAVQDNINTYHDIWKANAYISTWYDQSLNANHATQSSFDSQPLIFDADNGGVVMQNLDPAIDFDGDNDFLTITDPTQLPTGAVARSFFLTVNPVDISAKDTLFSYGGANNYERIDIGLSNDDFAIEHDNHRFGVERPDLVYSVYSMLLPAAAQSNEWSFYKDATLLNSAQTLDDTPGAVNTGSTYAYIGAKDSESVFYQNAKYQDLIVYALDQADDASDIVGHTRNNYTFTLSQKKPRNRRRTFLIRKRKINDKLDVNKNKIIDFEDLVIILARVKKANKVGAADLSLEEMQQVDLDFNHTFNDNDEKIIRKELSLNPNYEEVNSLIETTSTDVKGNINFKNAKEFIQTFKKNKRKSKKLIAQGKLQASNDIIEAYDSNKNNIIDQDDKSLAVDYLQVVLGKRYSAQKIQRFLKKNKFKHNGSK